MFLSKLVRRVVMLPQRLQLTQPTLLIPLIIVVLAMRGLGLLVFLFLKMVLLQRLLHLGPVVAAPVVVAGVLVEVVAELVVRGVLAVVAVGELEAVVVAEMMMGTVVFLVLVKRWSCLSPAVLLKA